MMQIRIQHACVCRLQSANRVRKFMDKGEVTISTARLLTECQLKQQRSKRASRSLSFLLFFVAYAVAVFLQRNGERGEPSSPPRALGLSCCTDPTQNL